MSQVSLLQVLLDRWVNKFSTLVSDPRTAQNKLQEEVDEFLQAMPGSVHKREEAADVLIVVLTQMEVEDVSIEEVLWSVEEKLHVNLQRNWALNPDGTVSHVKDVSGKEGERTI